MALRSMRVLMPRNRLIYINGDYSHSAGNSSMDSFTVNTGGNIAETRNGAGAVDYRKRFRVKVTDRLINIELEALDPPEPT